MFNVGKSVSPNSLRVFESAARHLSFTKAARELRSTQSAVSQQIRQIEEQLGFQLFDRIYRGVRLTEAGQVLFASVQDGFGLIEQTIDRLQKRTRHPHLNILTDFSFASYWLMPRLPQFRAQHPDIDVRIITNQGVMNWKDQGVDIALLFCDEQTLETVPVLFYEEVFPICSLGFLEQNGPIDTPEALSRLALLTLTADEGQSWMDWPHYFRQKGVTQCLDSAELAFNNYTLLIQAAIAGQGVCLGWRGLVDDLLRAGMLVELPGLTLNSRRGYGVVDVHPETRDEVKDTFRNWALGYKVEC
ncbi:LysR substrate-binding domain-containing protein [Nitrincola sp. MINF-07-Sa-05]|uniref:LysR substrate-binding domain-containing protein n=1 Tax=Nitrincola salilacus TaxID=3400273 RepID=UPI003917ED0C